MEVEKKQCKECIKSHDVSSFRLSHGKYRGNICHECRSIRRKERHDKEKHDETLVERAKERSRIWRMKEENKQSNSDYHKVWQKTTTAYWSQKLNTIRSNCKSRGLEYDIDRPFLQELYDKQFGKCELTGRTLVLTRIDTKSEERINTCSVDRIDNSKGYIKGNIRLITLQANSAKWTGNDEELLAFCKDVIQNLSSLKDSQ